MHHIYKIINNINNKIYIGQTNDMYQRWAQYKNCATSENSNNTQLIVKAMRKHGFDNFKMECIATATNIGIPEGADKHYNINEAEALIIEQEDARNLEIGYNLDSGGNAIERSPETIAKIIKGRLKYFETHAGSMKNRKHLPESIKKMSESAMGKPGTNIGKKFSEETKRKMSESAKKVDKSDTRRFLPEEEKEICRLYSEDKLSTDKLSKQFKCSKSTILEIFKRENVETRKGKKQFVSRRFFIENEEQKICSLYMNGETSITKLGNKFICSKELIKTILFENNINLIKSKNKFNKETENKICELYDPNIHGNATLLARQFGCSLNVIRRILKSSGLLKIKKDKKWLIVRTDPQSTSL
jgi:group I intron endonuclease